MTGVRDSKPPSRGEGRIEIITAETRVAIRRENFENPGVQFENRNIKGASTQIINRHAGFLPEPVQAVGQRGGGGFRQNSLHKKPRQLPGSLGCRSLRVVEISRNGDHRPIHALPAGPLQVGFELGEDVGGNFLGRKDLTIDQNTHPAPGPRPNRIVGGGLDFFVSTTTDESFHGSYNPRGVDFLFLHRQPTDEFFSIGSKPHRRRRESPPLPVGHQNRKSALHDTHQRVGGAQINTGDHSGQMRRALFLILAARH